MATSYITYRDLEFSAPDGIIDYAQKYLVRKMEITGIPDWVKEFKEDIALDIEMDMTRSFYLDDDFEEESKREWMVEYLRLIMEDEVLSSNEQLGEFIVEEIQPELEIDRVKNVLFGVQQLLVGEISNPMI